MFDYLIKGGKLVDGIGCDFKQVDIGVEGTKIARLGERDSFKDSDAREVIDARGLIVSPGFIDIHTHDDFIFWGDPYVEGKLRQGVTTLVVGSCGASAAPLPSVDNQDLEDYRLSRKATIPEQYPWTARTMGDYLKELEELKPAINVLAAVGHSIIRITVMGYEERKPTDDEMSKMKKLARQSIKEGAIAFSTGLIYPPGSYANTEEIIELAKEVAAEGGMYFSHIRSESHHMEQALKEAINIGKSASIPVQISHFKCLGKSSWGEAEKRLSLLDAAREQGIKIACDQYPYEANSTRLIGLLPPEAQNKGIDSLITNLKNNNYRQKIRKIMLEDTSSWENFLYEADGWKGVMIGQAPGARELEGYLVSDIIKKTGKDPFEQVFDIIIETDASATMILFTMHENDIVKIMKYPWTCIGSDGLPGLGKAHPRFHGTFPRVLARYAREKKVLDIFEAIKKMTSLPASILGLKDRGIIAEGKRADLVLFDYDQIEDKATYSNPNQYPIGIPHVIVGGQPVLKLNKLTDLRPGKVGL